MSEILSEDAEASRAAESLNAAVARGILLSHLMH